MIEWLKWLFSGHKMAETQREHLQMAWARIEELERASSPSPTELQKRAEALGQQTAADFSNVAHMLDALGDRISRLEESQRAQPPKRSAAQFRDIMDGGSHIKVKGS